MLHPDTELKFIHPSIGYGIIALKFIPKGTITWVRDELDREFTSVELDKLNPALKETILTYCYRNHLGNYIFCWDHTKYINHSHSSNTMPTPYGFEIAITDIQPGEEITNDYGTLNIIEPFSPYESPEHRKTINPDDILRFHQLWDTQINEAYKHVSDVKQPLKSILTEDQKEVIELISRGNYMPKSILSNLYNQKKSLNSI